MIRTYKELCSLRTFEERFRYLQLGGVVGKATFGSDRWINQRFYKSSREWKSIRDLVIIRDNGCDLASEDHPITERVYIHHMNPISVSDISEQSEFLLNPEYLICTSFNTHQAIHYGDESLLITMPPERSRFDTCPWRH